MFEKIQYIAVIKESQHRSIRRAIDSVKFQALFLDSNAENQKKLLSIVERGDLESFKLWVRTERQKQLSLMQVGELREKACRLGILNFTVLSKNMLMHEITVREEEKAKLESLGAET